MARLRGVCQSRQVRGSSAKNSKLNGTCSKNTIETCTSVGRSRIGYVRIVRSRSLSSPRRRGRVIEILSMIVLRNRLRTARPFLFSTICLFVCSFVFFSPLFSLTVGRSNRSHQRVNRIFFRPLTSGFNDPPMCLFRVFYYTCVRTRRIVV